MLLLSHLKNKLVGDHRSPRTVQSGAFRGLRLNLDLRAQTLLWLGVYEREIQPWLAELSEGIGCALDIGAADGLYSLYFLMNCPSAKVLSFDNRPEVGTLIRENLDLNGFKDYARWQFVPRAVGSGTDASGVSLAAFAREIAHPCLIKMDVEGAELEVLDASTEILSCKDSRWIVETHALDLELACARKFAEFGYETTIVDNAWWRCILPERRPIPHNRWLIAVRS